MCTLSCRIILCVLYKLESVNCLSSLGDEPKTSKFGIRRSQVNII